METISSLSFAHRAAFQQHVPALTTVRDMQCALMTTKFSVPISGHAITIFQEFFLCLHMVGAFTLVPPGWFPTTDKLQLLDYGTQGSYLIIWNM